MKQKLMLLAFLALMLGVISTSFADVITIGSGTSYSYEPIASYYGYHRSAAIYTAGEVGGSGTITTISYKAYNTNSTSIPIKVYMKMTTATSLSPAQNWGTLTSGLTALYNATFSGTTAGAWKTITLATPFNYTGNNLMILVESNYGGGGTSGPQWYYSTATSMNQYIRKDNSAPTTETGTVNSSRPQIQLNLDGYSVFAPTFSVSPTSVNFGVVAVNTTTAYTNVTVSNNGAGTLNISDVQLTGADAGKFILDMNSNPVPWALGAGASKTVKVAFNPTAVASYSAALRFVGNVKVDHDVALSGSGVDPVNYDIPYTQDFEEITTAGSFPAFWTTTGSKWSTQVSAQNYGRAARSGTDYATCAYSASATDFMFSRGQYLDASKSYDFGIWYNTDGYAGWSSFKMFIGTAATSAGMTTELASVSSPVNTTYTQLTRTAWQPPTSGVYYLGFQVMASSSPWYMSFDDFTVTETPADPLFAINPSSKDFGSKGVFTQTDQIFTVSNAGQGTLKIEDMQYEGNDCFTLIDPPAEYPVLLGTGETMTFTVRYAPLVAGDYSGQIKITDNLEAKSQHIVDLLGTAFDPIIPLPYEQNFNAGTTLPTNWTQSSTTWTIGSSHGRTGNAIYKNIYSSVPTAWFQTQPIGPITGTTRLSFFYRWADYAYSGYPTTAHTPGAGDNIKVWVSTDEGLTFNQYSEINSTNHVTSLNWAEKQIWLSGAKANNGDRIVLKFEANWGSGDWYIDIDDITAQHVDSNPVFAVSPTTKDFGDVQIGTTVSQVFTITNQGLGSLEIASGGVTVDGLYYSLTDANSYPITLGAGQTAQVTVSFKPTVESAEAYNGVLAITDNLTKTTHSINLTGKGIDSSIHSFPYVQDFEGTVFPPAGWTKIVQTGNDITRYAGASANHTYGGNYSARFSSYSSSSDYNQYLFTSPINVTEPYTNLSFWHLKYGDYEETLEWGIATDTNPSSFTWTPVTLDYMAYQKSSIDISAYAGQTVYLGFHYYGDFQYYVYLDDIRIGREFDYPNSVPIAVGEETITVTGGNANNGNGTVPDVNNVDFVTDASYILDLIGAGPWTVSIQTTAQYGAYYTNNRWYPVPNIGGYITFEINANKDMNLPIVIGNQDPTLPVELSSFTATLTSDMFVNIAWIAQSETNHAGYNVYRAESDALDSALKLNPALINDGTSLGTQISYSFSDFEAYTNMKYYYWLESMSLDGASDFYGPLTVTIGDPTQEPQAPNIPIATALQNAFPNPFNPITNLRYTMKEAGKVNISIYNVKGQLVRSFAKDHNSPGYYHITWDGRDNNGKPVSSGIYMYRMTSGNYSAIKKMILSK